MSYDIELCVKVAGAENIYAVVARPDHDNPTYNLREMFVACMGWDYHQLEEDESGEYHSVYYPCTEVIKYAARGLYELSINEEKYKQYNSPNGWGTTNGAKKTLNSLIECINETKEHIPLECLYMKW